MKTMFEVGQDQQQLFDHVHVKRLDRRVRGMKRERASGHGHREAIEFFDHVVDICGSEIDQVGLQSFGC